MTLNTGIMLFVTNAFSLRRNYYAMRVDGRIGLLEPNWITHRYCVSVSWDILFKTLLLTVKHVKH